MSDNAFLLDVRSGRNDEEVLSEIAEVLGKWIGAQKLAGRGLSTPRQSRALMSFCGQDPKVDPFIFYNQRSSSDFLFGVRRLLARNRTMRSLRWELANLLCHSMRKKGRNRGAFKLLPSIRKTTRGGWWPRQDSKQEHHVMLHQ